MRFLVRFFGALAVLAALGAGAARPAQAGVVLSDPLTSWPLNLGSQTQYVLLKNNAVHITEPGPYAAWVIYAGFNFTDFDASVTVTPTVSTGSAAGLIFWAADYNDFYQFAVLDASGTFDIVRHTAGPSGGWQTIVPQTKAAAIKTGGPNVLRVVTKGSLVALYVNGQSIGSLQLMPPTAGGTVGFEGEGITGKVSDYVFSNLSVSD